MSLICKLCGLNPPIENSHVWPKFAYRRYVANQQIGGAFADLDTLHKTSRQKTRSWFCKNCEQLFGESYTARFLDGLQSNRAAVDYDSEDLLRFAVSCSLRTCLFELEEQINAPTRKKLIQPCDAWRTYLLNEASNVAPYTQHAYIFDLTDVDGRMGMLVDYGHGFAITHIGPFLIFGLIRALPLNGQEAWALDQSKVRINGGKAPILIADEVNYSLTESMRNALDYAELHICLRSRDYNKSLKRNKKSN
jgi:hypothetical protein